MFGERLENKTTIASDEETEVTETETLGLSTGPMCHAHAQRLPPLVVAQG